MLGAGVRQHQRRRGDVADGVELAGRREGAQGRVTPWINSWDDECAADGGDGGAVVVGGWRRAAGAWRRADAAKGVRVVLVGGDKEANGHARRARGRSGEARTGWSRGSVPAQEAVARLMTGAACVRGAREACRT